MIFTEDECGCSTISVQFWLTRKMWLKKIQRGCCCYIITKYRNFIFISFFINFNCSLQRWPYYVFVVVFQPKLNLFLRKWMRHLSEWRWQKMGICFFTTTLIGRGCTILCLVKTTTLIDFFSPLYWSWSYMFLFFLQKKKILDSRYVTIFFTFHFIEYDF